jgi:hypothetical protein
MRRALMFTLGVGLLVLWICEVRLPELSTPEDVRYTDARGWIVWLDALAAIYAFFGAAPTILRARKWAAILCIGLAILWIVGLTSNVPAWVAWWNFAFAVMAGLIALISPRFERERSATPGERTEPPSAAA